MMGVLLRRVTRGKHYAIKEVEIERCSFKPKMLIRIAGKSPGLAQGKEGKIQSPIQREHGLA